MAELRVTDDDFVDAIQRYVAAHGYPPAIRDLAIMLDYRSTAGIVARLKSLERAGRIRRGPHGTSRSLSVIE